MDPRRHRIVRAARRAAMLADTALIALTASLAIFVVAVLAAHVVGGPATSVITFRQGR